MIHGIDTTFLVQVEVREAPGHETARIWLTEALARHSQPLALAPQVLTEFVHVVTDPRRFSAPLSMDEALEKAQGWWESTEVKPVYPSLESTRLTLLWMRQYRLGRKRLLDTQLAATYYAADVTRLLTLNMSDFEIFGVFRPSRSA
ncbi:MAG: tRNA(fMet)-specific endonuclease VapC [Verrucomicrobiota bacterium]|jgi:predicted nucleic acid-binding protein